MKVPIELVAACLKKNEVAPAILRRIIDELNIEAQPAEGDEPAPHVKKQFAILVSDPEGKLPKDDFVGWVLQISESESVATTEDRIRRAAYDFNASRKGRLLPVKTVGDALENVPAKYFKEAEAWVKTKTPVLVLRTNNDIPRDNSAKA